VTHGMRRYEFARSYFSFALQIAPSPFKFDSGREWLFSLSRITRYYSLHIHIFLSLGPSLLVSAHATRLLLHRDWFDMGHSLHSFSNGVLSDQKHQGCMWSTCQSPSPPLQCHHQLAALSRPSYSFIVCSRCRQAVPVPVGRAMVTIKAST
jgi:hypothetical protein